jgi:hypothetical protein
LERRNIFNDERKGRQGVVKSNTLRVARLMKVDPTVIKAVAKELRIAGATNTSIAVENVLRIEGRGREYLFVLSEDFRENLPLKGDLQATNWTGKCLS